jgi:hypothetical protein
LVFFLFGSKIKSKRLIQDEDVGELDTEYLQSQLKKQMDKFESEKLAEKNQNEIAKVLIENELGTKHVGKSPQISTIKVNEIILIENRNEPKPNEDDSGSNQEVSTENMDESESDEGITITIHNCYSFA